MIRNYKLFGLCGILGIAIPGVAVEVIEKKVDEETPIASQQRHIVAGVQLGIPFATQLHDVSTEKGSRDFTSDANTFRHNYMSGLFVGYQFKPSWLVEFEYLYLPVDDADIFHFNQEYILSNDSRIDGTFINAVYQSDFLTSKYRPYAAVGLGVMFSDLTMKLSRDERNVKSNADSALAGQLKIGFTKEFYESVVYGISYGYITSFETISADMVSNDGFDIVRNSGRYSTQLVSYSISLRF